MYEDLLPRPRELMPAPGQCPVSHLTTVDTRGLPQAAAALLEEDLGVTVRVAPGPPFAARVGQRASGDGSLAEGLLAGRIPDTPEGFALVVGERGIEVAAADAAGLWYGLQTVVQLVQSGADVLAALSALYEPATVADVIGSRFAGDDELAQATRTALARTTPEPTDE
jgi:hypothetical protein